MASFWGEPTFQPNSADTEKLITSIRELTKNQNPNRTLAIATSSFKAIVFFVVDKFGAREALALLDSIRNEVMGMRQ